MAENLDHPFFLAFSNVAEVAERTGSTADVAGPRPREVGGACRIQVLAVARTQETVGGPNGAKRSEFRRCCMPVGVCKSGIFAPVVLQIDHHGGRSWAFAPVAETTWANARRLPPQSIHTARHFQQIYMLAQQKTPEPPLHSALEPLCLKTNPENKITCWRIRRFRGGVPDRRRDPGRSGASCQSAC